MKYIKKRTPTNIIIAVIVVVLLLFASYMANPTLKIIFWCAAGVVFIWLVLRSFNIKLIDQSEPGQKKG